ncbi:DUF4129 domain-containing protein [Paenibacillus thermotolerans]|uniref:DUF4129 domain-containing protein n=1 Tax=Paenibacillus thermotolerans TaxID=3027807 RepID=UPI002368B901|nr:MULTISPECIES: DUF4129 domain-containing protein [unclassified Paenibacillus]
MRLEKRQLWFGALEGFVALAWIVLLSGLVERVEELMFLLAVPLLLAVGAAAVYAAHRLGLVKWSAAAGALPLAIGAVWIISRLGGTAFLTWFPLIGFVFVLRFGSIVSGDARAEERFRVFFLQESVVFPMYSVICFHYAFKHGVVSPAVLAAAVAAYFAIRFYVLVQVQRTYRGDRLIGARTALPVIICTAGLLVVVAALPYAFLLLGWMSAPLLYVLSPLFEWLRERAAELELTLPSAGEELSELDPERLQGMEPTAAAAAVPNWVWAIALLAALAAVMAFVHRKRNRRAEPIRSAAQVRISRSKWSENSSLSYVRTDSAVRRLYQQMLRWYEKKGHPILPSETAKEYAARLRAEGRVSAASGDEMRALSDCYERVRYGGDGVKEGHELEPEPLKLRAQQALERIRTLEK